MRGRIVGGGKTHTGSFPAFEIHALLIGTDHFKALDALKTPLNDVRVITKQLFSNHNFTTKVLENQSKDSVMAQVVRYTQTLDSTNHLLIYVAGHGDYDAIFDDGFFVFTDSKPKAQDPY